MIGDTVSVNDRHSVARFDDIALGELTSSRLLGEDLVVWRGETGIHAWQDPCVHRGTRLSPCDAASGVLVCPNHGWRYIESGRCIHMPAHPDQIPPAKAKVVTFQARERYGLVWVCLGEPEQDVPIFPGKGAGYRHILSGPFGPIRASAPRLIENFLDVAHFPFVHAGVLGDADRPEIAPYEVKIETHGITARNILIFQPDPYGTGVGEDVTYTYHVLRPFTAYFSKETKAGEHLSILFPITLHDERSSSAWFYKALRNTEGLIEAEVLQFHSRILAQDIPIVESQRPEMLPLGLQAELHLRSDRTSIAYRK